MTREFSNESKAKMSVSARNRFKVRHYWWTNGKEDKFSPTCPGEDFFRGRTRGQFTPEGKQRHDQALKGNKHAVAKWNWWELG